MLVDSHCHIDFPPLAERTDSVLSNARKNGVDYLLCVAVNLEDYPNVLALAENNPHIFASVGVHPNETDGRNPSVNELVTLGQHEKVVAIGETGLDYFRSTGDLEWQHERFRRHIEAAREVQKPLIIHNRDAGENTVRWLRDHHAKEAGGVMHCFADSWSIAKQALDLGFYISFSGIVTFKSAEDIREVAKKTPLDRLLVETDAPYLAPVPYRGKTNEPAFVRHTAEAIAELRRMDFSKFARATTDNFFNLFKHAKSK